jgi:site-specific DNA-methyltransferase (adenine-specific)
VPQVGCDVPITAPATALAAKWDGWGTALKPAWEPIILAMKPPDGTYANNALKWGVAGINVDGGRIATVNAHPSGRWPANLLLSEDTAAMLDEQSGVSRSNPQPRKRGSPAYCGGWRTGPEGTPFHSDTGGASRFFYVAKASRREREAGLEGCEVVEREGQSAWAGRWPANLLLDEEAAAMLDEQSGVRPAGIAVRHKGGGNTFGGNSVKPPMADMTYADTGGASRFFYVAKASRREREAGCEKLLSNHPTVKPLALMRYLVKLTATPTGGVVLDPFAGSGSTGCACALEGREFIGIEQEPEYAEIAERRIAYWETLHDPLPRR